MIDFGEEAADFVSRAAAEWWRSAGYSGGGACQPPGVVEPDEFGLTRNLRLIGNID
jgi:hypothetical protein